MSTKTRTILSIAALGVLDAVALGVPVVALLLLYVVIERPPWFLNLVRDLYGE